MRIILYTGKGGVGKTSIAAATAIKSADLGKKTLVVSTDPAHSLGDSLDMKLSSEPLEIQKNLYAQEIDTIHEIERGWGKIQQYIKALFTLKTVEGITAEELTVFPGMEELLSLLRIINYYKQKTYDVIIIDCAPTGETLALLSFPEILSWWMEKLFPFEKKVVKVLRPIAEPLLGIPMPSNDVMDEIGKIYEQLDEMKRILSNRDITSVRIVVNPEKMVIKEAQRSFTYLNIYDFNVDAIVVNRMIPERVTDNYFAAWKAVQKKYKELIVESFSPLPIHYAPLFDHEVVGIDMLSKMGNEVFADKDCTAIEYNARTQQVLKDGNDYILSIYMPFTDRHDLSLNQKGDDIIVKVGNVKRLIALPRTIQGLEISNARFKEDTLDIRFKGVDNK